MKFGAAPPLRERGSGAPVTTPLESNTRFL
jgi:hypothetical protein